MSRTRKPTIVIGVASLLVLAVFVPPAFAPYKAKIGDFVWEDSDQDGIQDAGEMGIPGVQVNLYVCGGTVPIASMTTDAAGLYLFEPLDPGDYYVEFILPPNYVFSPQDQGADNAVDSDADPVTGKAVCTTVVHGDDDRTWDAGMYKVTEPPGACPGTPGYWKNHAELWPVDQITIGGVLYTKADALDWMWEKGKSDKSLTMFAALVAAKLNVLIGCDSSCIADTIAAADEWMADHPVGSGVKPGSSAWDEGEPLYLLLDAYNNGELCSGT